MARILKVSVSVTRKIDTLYRQNDVTVFAEAVYTVESERRSEIRRIYKELSATLDSILEYEQQNKRP